MKTTCSIILSGLLLILFFQSCKSGSSDSDAIATDSLTISQGEISFNKNCSGCHNFRQDGIGPQLSGLTEEVSPSWIHHFIENPQKMIDTGDARATALFKKYHTTMPSFAAQPVEEIDAIIAFLNTHKSKGKKAEDANDNSLKNPIPDSIQYSGLVVNIKAITRFPASSDSGKTPLARITKLDYQPKTKDLFVLDLRGKLYKMVNDQPVEYMDMHKLEPKFINEPGLATGFGSFAFHPDFAKNGLLYTTHTEPAKTATPDFGFADSIKQTLQWVLTEWKTGKPGTVPFAGTGRELLRISMVEGIHGVQEIVFNPQAKPGSSDYGLLYIGIGDGGAVEAGYPFLAHDPAKPWGSVFRIDPAGRNSANGKYGIPAQNPFVKNHSANALGEIYAYGFRNPHRITWTSSGLILVSNVGHGNIESVNLLEPGHDYGWPIREGKFVVNPSGNLNKIYSLPADDSSYHITYPIAEYDHDEGKAVTGGYEYTGKNIPALKGKFIFGDIPSGRLFFINMADIKQGKQAVIKEWKISIDGATETFSHIYNKGRVDMHFGKDADGELYILTKLDGKMYKLVGAATK